MRFEILYGTGTRHEVTLPGSLVVLGRDPGCDIVLNDEKCSRRHAVVEDSAGGLEIRDSESANGVFVNGRRVRRSPLHPGDTIRVGGVQLVVLAEIGETLVVALDDGDASPHTRPVPVVAPPPAPVPSAPAERSRRPSVAAAPRSPAATPSRPHGRPLTVSVLSGLWGLAAPVGVAAVVATAWKLGAGPVGWLGAAGVSVVLVALTGLMALGLHALAPWARHLQITCAYLGLLVCPLTLASATVLFYMARSDVRHAFERVREPAGASGASAEPTFAVSILAMLVAGFGLTALALLLLWPNP